VFAVYAVAAPLRLYLTGGIALTAGGLGLGWFVSALWHLALFTTAGLVLTIISTLAGYARSPARTHYWLLWAIATAAVTFVLLRVLLAPLAIRGAAAWLVSIAAAVAVASAWSGVARHAAAGRSAVLAPLDLWLAPLALGTSRTAVAIGLVGAAVLTHLSIGRIWTFDWEFMLQKLVTLALWVVAFGFIQTLASNRAAPRRFWIGLALVVVSFAAGEVLLSRLAVHAHDGGLNPEFAVDSYAAVDPSFRVARDLFGSGTPADAAEFYGFLRAHSTIQGRQLEPVDVDFVREWSARWPTPHVFLFIVDSLRPDYLSPYNKTVGFTPAIDAFAADSFVFKRAFSRYAGTGLSVPAIWAGSMIIHKQYVTPFGPTNALEKLVSAKGYRRFITEDHLTSELFEASPDTMHLDRQVPEMLHTFCRTTGELARMLEERSLHEGHGAGKARRPIFVLTRPLELHIGNIASAKVPPDESYPGFHAPYASRVRRIDACFGEFLDTLRRTKLYDNSVIVLTSDHGDSLGEGQRWGHGFTAFPEVLRIPLIIRVPEAIRGRLSADLARVSFSTDITPTLYALLGESPGAHGSRGVRDLLIGSPLFVDASTDLSWRRRESYLVASSYGPVYGLVSRNGRHLYLADGVESREYAFDLSADRSDVRVGMTDAEREASRQAIRQQIGELANWYGYSPEP
jgi:hypothetical protein